MTDVATAELVDQRLAALEAWAQAQQARQAPGLRANPPVIIPPYSNVPAPGSPIRSDWPQQITTDVAKNVMTRVGVGVILSSLSIPNGNNPTIAWPSEAYDTHNFHAAGSTDLIIPAGWDGIYIASLTLTASGSLSAGPALVRLLFAGGTKQATIIQGQSIASVAHAGPLAAGNLVQASCWNASGGAVFFGGSLELLRVAA